MSSDVELIRVEVVYGDESLTYHMASPMQGPHALGFEGAVFMSPIHVHATAISNCSYLHVITRADCVQQPELA